MLCPPSSRFLLDSLPNMEANGEQRRSVHAPRSQQPEGRGQGADRHIRKQGTRNYAVAGFCPPLRGERRHGGPGSVSGDAEMNTPHSPKGNYNVQLPVYHYSRGQRKWCHCFSICCGSRCCVASLTPVTANRRSYIICGGNIDVMLLSEYLISVLHWRFWLESYYEDLLARFWFFLKMAEKPTDIKH